MTDTMDLSRRQLLVAGSTFAGYALAADTVLAQAIKTDTDGLAAGEFEVRIGDYGMPVYEARPASGTGHPIVVVISEIWGVHEYIRDSTRRFAKDGYHAVAPELFKREGGVAQLTNVQDILKIVLGQKREQTLGDLKAAADWAKTRPGARADRVGVTGWCWGGSTTIQVAATNPDIKAAVAWYGPPGRPYQGASGPVTGFDLAKDIKAPFLGLFGETDTSPKPEDALRFGELLKQHGNKDVEIVVYPGAGHAFHADYRPSYKPEAAADAWKRCVGWFDKYLKG
ncbi:MAG TPA: dienelactone hydrolase family protein [Candidatus Limnocylindria bacterium]|nr:dienelactone hydrolase family protein [Candidatus Limnocylindria bacterium]